MVIFFPHLPRDWHQRYMTYSAYAVSGCGYKLISCVRAYGADG